jgi:hypothetical protein
MRRITDKYICMHARRETEWRGKDCICMQVYSYAFEGKSRSSEGDVLCAGGKSRSGEGNIADVREKSRTRGANVEYAVMELVYLGRGGEII